MVLDAYLIGLRCTLPTALRALPLPTVLRLIAPRTPRSRATSARAHQAVARSEVMARRLSVADTCLYRSMVRWTALKRAGLPATFVMGVRRDEPDTGHAWVEVDGEPVGELVDDRLVATFRFP